MAYSTVQNMMLKYRGIELTSEFMKYVAEQKELFEAHLLSWKREGMADLVAWLNTTSFYRDPASTKFHSAHDAGLLIHSLGVAHTFNKFVKENPIFEISLETSLVAGLLHDLCKIGCYEQKERFRKDKNDRWEKYPGYEWVPEALPLGHGAKSIEIASRFIKLTDQEKLLLYWHMGPMTTADGNDFYNVCSRFPEVAFLHAADLVHSKCFEPQELIEPLVGVI